MADETNSNGVAIIGGGITGLYTALQALDRGQTDIHVYEASERLGGKIRSGSLAGQTINLGAEFIDSDDSRLIALCERLGVTLEPTGEQGSEVFQLPNGRILSAQEFHQHYAPIASLVIRHREAIARDPNGPLAQRLKSLPLDAYMAELQRQAPAAVRPSFLQRMRNLFLLRGNRVDANITAAAMTAFSHELGRTPDQITASQFVFESSPSTNRLLASDCAYRVQGGTERIIHALRDHLAARGVQFHTGHALQGIAAKGNQTTLQFQTMQGMRSIQANRLVLGLPAYALAKIEGLQSLGIAPAHQQLLGDVQYTNNVKFTVALKPGVTPPDVNFFSAYGECWSPSPGFLTFLCHNPGTQAPQQLMQQALANYARGLGTTPQAMFQLTPGSIAFTNPGKASCWSTPSPKNMRQSEALFKSMDTLAERGIGVAGTYMPHEGTVGFMECGLAASDRMATRLFGETLQHDVLAKTPKVSFVEREAARRAVQPQQAQLQ